MIDRHSFKRPAAAAVPIILDTDMGNDVDDALALAMLHTLQSYGECDLRAVTVCKDNPYAAAYVDLVNTFYGRGNVDVGLVRGGVTPEPGAFVRAIVEKRSGAGRPIYPCTAASLEAYPDAVAVLRAQLAAAAPRSVVIVMIGFSTNLARLLDSGPDANSPRPGRELLAHAARGVVMMAGEFSDEALASASPAPEYNVLQDIASAQQFVAECPVPIVFSGFEVGLAIPFPARAIEEGFTWAARHPVVDAYRLFRAMPYDRPTWDLTAVLFAVRSERGYFGLSPRGRVRVDDRGAVHFVGDSDGPHQYLRLDGMQRARVAAVQVRLASAPSAPAAAPSIIAPCSAQLHGRAASTSQLSV